MYADMSRRLRNSFFARGSVLLLAVLMLLVSNTVYITHACCEHHFSHHQFDIHSLEADQHADQHAESHNVHCFGYCASETQWKPTCCTHTCSYETLTVEVEDYLPQHSQQSVKPLLTDMATTLFVWTATPLVHKPTLHLRANGPPQPGRTVLAMNCILRR